MRFENVEFLNLILNKLLQALMKCLGVIIQKNFSEKSRKTKTKVPNPFYIFKIYFNNKNNDYRNNKTIQMKTIVN